MQARTPLMRATMKTTKATKTTKTLLVKNPDPDPMTTVTVTTTTMNQAMTRVTMETIMKWTILAMTRTTSTEKATPPENVHTLKTATMMSSHSAPPALAHAPAHPLLPPQMPTPQTRILNPMTTPSKSSRNRKIVLK
jgi:hypothetical protein